MYGVLSNNERSIRGGIGAANSFTTANDKFNLLILSDNQQRFELLPVPNQQTQPQQIPANFDKQSQIKSQMPNLVSNQSILKKRVTVI